MDTIIIQIPYWIIYSDSSVVDELNLNPYLLNEWLRDSNDLCSIEITKDNLWILDWLKEYLSYNNNNND